MNDVTEPNDQQPDFEGFPADEIIAVVDQLEQAGITYQINGGWGVDALVGRQTRSHQDVDVFIDAMHWEDVTTWLTERGYEVIGDYLPVAQDWANGRWKLDLHPMVLDDDGNGHQSGEKAQFFFHPAAGRTTGVIGGRDVVVASLEHQLRLHTGYTPRDVDIADLVTLETLRPATATLPQVTLPDTRPDLS